MRDLFLELLLLGVAATATHQFVMSRKECVRLEQNQVALTSELEHYTSRLGEEVASSAALRLRIEEFEQLEGEYLAQLRALNLKLKRLESFSHTATESEVEFSAPILPAEPLLEPPSRHFHWRDAWVEVAGELHNDSLRCRVRSVDTLLQVVHRIPRRFLFFRWGTKALRQEIVSKNPHSRVVYAEYIQIERSRRR